MGRLEQLKINLSVDWLYYRFLLVLTQESIFSAGSSFFAARE